MSERGKASQAGAGAGAGTKARVGESESKRVLRSRELQLHGWQETAIVTIPPVESLPLEKAWRAI